MKKNVLITGGCGFIGSNLIRYLKKSNNFNKIKVIDNLSNGSKFYLPNYVEFINGDILDFKLSKKITKDVDIIFHLAAESGVPTSIKNPLKSILVNILGTQNYLESSRINNIEKFIFASSGGTVLGDQNPPVHEESLMKPKNPYGASKASCEHLINSYNKSFGLNTTIFRFGNVYGLFSSHKKGNLIPEFLKSFVENKPFNVFGDGSQTRDFIYVNDLVEVLYECIFNDKTNGETFQLANEKEISVQEIIDIMNRILYREFGRKVKIKYTDERFGDIKRNYANIDKIKKILNYSPKYNNFEDGFAHMIKNINL